MFRFDHPSGGSAPAPTGAVSHQQVGIASTSDVLGVLYVLVAEMLGVKVVEGIGRGSWEGRSGSTGVSGDDEGTTASEVYEDVSADDTGGATLTGGYVGVYVGASGTGNGGDKVGRSLSDTSELDVYV